MFAAQDVQAARVVRRNTPGSCSIARARAELPACHPVTLEALPLLPPPPPLLSAQPKPRPAAAINADILYNEIPSSVRPFVLRIIWRQMHASTDGVHDRRVIGRAAVRR